ncbi:MAG: Eco57I restriction-modification methylase domain-containing protein, partial [Candidatus Latescibacteria bacterium]|nr:Eco57I restriction-modification methylase domain-containing protein [Candidatus Latescibacterota bacterium]
LSCALCEKLAERPTGPKAIDIEAYEIDLPLADCLEVCLLYAKQWLQARRITLNFTVNTDDFVMTQAKSLDSSLTLFPVQNSEDAPFDIVISNPPYFKISKSDPRARAAAAVVHGQPNIYALFMAISASLLKPGGELVFITPRSYAAGPYFRLFRKRFFETMKPEAIHLFGSRHDAFGRDEILQEHVILRARRSDGWHVRPNNAVVKVSSSAGINDLSRPDKRDVLLSEVLDFASKDKVLRIPIAEEDDDVARIVGSWPGTLHTYRLEISTGPVVPFRAVSLITESGHVPKTHAPLLWMQNVTSMRVEWPTKARSKGQYIVTNAASTPLLVADKNYVLLRRFSSKEQARRLTAAPFLAGKLNSPCIGLENHLNYIYRPGGVLTEEETYGLAALFNSTLLDRYFRTYNGNTQVSATELRAMPLPPLDVIVEIGRRALSLHASNERIDALIEDTLHVNDHKISTYGAAHD